MSSRNSVVRQSADTPIPRGALPMTRCRHDSNRAPSRRPRWLDLLAAPQEAAHLRSLHISRRASPSAWTVIRTRDRSTVASRNKPPQRSRSTKERSPAAARRRNGRGHVRYIATRPRGGVSARPPRCTPVSRRLNDLDPGDDSLIRRRAQRPRDRLGRDLARARDRHEPRRHGKALAPNATPPSPTLKRIARALGLRLRITM